MDRWIAIHKDDQSYSKRWTEYCVKHDIPFRHVDCLSSGIIADLHGASGLLWNWLHYGSPAKMVANAIIRSLEQRSLPVFPSSDTCWHYDDKIAQKYLLESIEAPLVKTYVFYDLGSALRWATATTFPKVMKLRCGAGSQSVRLIATRPEAEKACRRAFGRGFPSLPSYFSDARRKVHGIAGHADLLGKIRRMPGRIASTAVQKLHVSREKNYAYFQDFISGNTYDTRITIIGNRAFGFRRFVRPSDFRASGSGRIDFDPRAVGHDLIHIAFGVAKRIASQSLAFDFVRDQSGRGLILENQLHVC